MHSFKQEFSILLFPLYTHLSLFLGLWVGLIAYAILSGIRGDYPRATLVSILSGFFAVVLLFVKAYA